MKFDYAGLQSRNMRQILKYYEVKCGDQKFQLLPIVIPSVLKRKSFFSEWVERG